MAVLVSRLLLAALFAAAATAKLRDLSGSERSITELGVPARWARAVAMVVPALELVAAGALLIGPSAPAGAALALVLLCVFSVAVGWSLARGRRPSCHCFGALSAQPAGWSSVARNALFATLAAFVLLDGRPVWVFVGAGVVSAADWAAPGIRRRWAERAGRMAEPFALPSVEGSLRTLDGLLGRGRPVVLVFSSPRCGGCEPLLLHLARWQARPDGLTFAMVSAGSAADTLAKAQEHGLRDVLVDEHQTAVAAYGVTATPTAVLVGRDGRVAASAVGADEIERLVADARAPEAQEPQTRRVALQRVATVAGLVLFAPLLDTVATASATVRRRRSIKVEGAWLCDQRYALCTKAACQPSATDPKVAICKCFVLDGYSMGYKTCAQRTPSGQRLVSSFSTQNVNKTFAIMTCPASAPWANCLDVRCHVDPDQPTHAICPCPIVDQGPSFTFGGACDTSTCTEVVWSGSAPPGVPFSKAMKAVGEKAHFPKTCPKR